VADIEKFVFTGDPAASEKILAGIGYYDADGALDVHDVEAQLRWFVEQKMVKAGADPAEIIDTRFLPTLPTSGP
jgi:NitT/TauT family transport system substrate-binding protein